LAIKLAFNLALSCHESGGMHALDIIELFKVIMSISHKKFNPKKKKVTVINSKLFMGFNNPSKILSKFT